jgi:carboxypeptidase C (cathepsin A)
MEKKCALGVDIGNVIINHRLTDPEDKTLHKERYSTIPATKGAFVALKKLNDYFAGEVYLISKCTEWAQEKILAWLLDNDFYSKTGISENNVRFVRERHEKDAVCQSLGITHFIDDRLEVLSHMTASTPYLFLFQPDPVEVERFRQFLPRVAVVVGWDSVIDKIL